MSEPKASPSTRCGLVAIVGVPNAGKSTLLNRLIGQKLSAVTSKAQTTRQSVTGIRSEGGVQMIFLDTPGLLEPRNLLQRGMLAAARDSALEADVLVAVLDARASGSRQGRSVVRDLATERSGRSVIAAINKVDSARPENVEQTRVWATNILEAATVTISAATGAGVPELIETITRFLPEGPFLYPEDDLSSENVRFFTQELIRETVFERYRQELPYSTVVEIGDFREGQDPVYIQATIFVERKSQKGILIGEKGAAIRDLGKAARKKIENLVGSPVYLDLWIKVLPNWRKQKAALTRFGYRIPEDTPHGS